VNAEVDACLIEATTEHSDCQMGSFVVFLSDAEDLQAKLKEVAEKENIKATVLSIDNPAGPGDYKVSKDADLTVVLCNQHKVKSNFAFKKGELKDKDIDVIVADISKFFRRSNERRNRRASESLALRRIGALFLCALASWREIPTWISRSESRLWPHDMTKFTLPTRPAPKRSSTGIRKPLRVVTLLAPNLLPVYEFITRKIASALGWPAELVVGASSEDWNDQTDICFLCGLHYIRLASLLEPIAAPILQGERYSGRPIYFSDIIVRADSPWQSFADLRGRSWAYNEPNSQSGYGIIRHHLAEIKETNDFFGSVVETGWHERSIHWVRSGRVDASAIDSHVLAIVCRDDPGLHSDLRIIGTLGPSTIQPVAASRRLPARLKSERVTCWWKLPPT
jgi:phosphonate transport system substrate-binding protein